MSVTHETSAQTPNLDLADARQEMFHDSAERLFFMLDRFGTDAASPTAPPVFYHVEWHDQYSSQVKRITAVELTPTGARRHAVRDKFAQAQFKAREYSEADVVVRQRFLWFYTGLQPLGVTVLPDIQAAQEDYGYEQLSPQNVVRTIATRAETAGDYGYLIRRMGEKGIELQPDIIKAVNRVVYDLVQGGLEAAKTSTMDTMESDEIFAVIAVLRDVNQDASRYLRGQLISRLLRGISWRLSEPYSEEQARKQQAAIETLQFAVERDVLTLDSSVMDRVLSYPTIYAYELGTKLLHELLTEQAGRSRTINLFSKHRTIVAHDYMLSYIYGRLVPGEELNNEMAAETRSALLQSSFKTYIKPPVDFDDIFAIAGRAYRRATGKNDSPWDTFESRQRLGNVGTAFMYILENILPDDPEAATQIRELNEMAGEIVDTILYPLRLEQIGRVAFAKARRSPMDEVIEKIRAAEIAKLKKAKPKQADKKPRRQGTTLPPQK